MRERGCAAAISGRILREEASARPGGRREQGGESKSRLKEPGCALLRGMRSRFLRRTECPLRLKMLARCMVAVTYGNDGPQWAACRSTQRTQNIIIDVLDINIAVQL